MLQEASRHQKWAEEDFDEFQQYLEENKNQ